MIKKYESSSNRKIRVFISSTFVDMQEERNILVQGVFPKLREYFKKQMIDIAEVDLRWGISEENINDYQMLEICIEEVLHCQPFFIGIIGDKYGTIADKNEIDNLSPYCKEALGDEIPDNISITELEMRAGVIVPQNKKYSCFFVRNNDDVSNEPRVEKLISSLKSDYRLYDYSNIDSFEEGVFNILKEFIYKKIYDYEIEPYNDPNYYSHLAILKNHNSLYIPCSSLVARMERIEDTFGQLLICGPKGIGKSACLSWLVYCNGVKRNKKVFFHFATAGLQSIHIDNVFYRLRIYLQEETGFICKKVDNHDAVIELIQHIDSKEKYVLYFDAIEQYDDPAAAYKLFAINEFKSNVHVVCSSTEENFANRTDTTVQLSGLSKEQVRQITLVILKKHGKRISTEWIDRIIEKENCANPMYLRTMLTQLRLYGNYSNLNEYFDRLLQSSSMGDLLYIILDQTGTYFVDRKIDTKYICEILALLIFSKNGVTESEIIEITHMYPIACNVLLSALNLFLIEDDGLYRFNHDLIIEKVKDYLELNGGIKFYQDKVASQFINLYLTNRDGIRAYCELTYQLFAQHKYEELYIILLDMECFSYLMENERYLLINYLSSLIHYQAVISECVFSKMEIDKQVDAIHILVDAGWNTSVLLHGNKLLDKVNDRQRIRLRDDIAWAQYTIGANHYINAINEYNVLLEDYIHTYPEDRIGYAIRYSKLGGTYKSAGMFSYAFEAYSDAVSILDKYNNIDGEVAWTYAIYGNACCIKGQFEIALDYFEKAHMIATRIYGKASAEIAWIYCYSWAAHFYLGEFSIAAQIAKNGLSICEKLYGGKGPKSAWAAQNYGIVSIVERNYSVARKQMELCIYENDICLNESERPHPYSLTAYCNIANIYELEGNHKKAVETINYALENSYMIHGENHIYTGNICLSKGIIERDVSWILLAIELYEKNANIENDLVFSKICLARVYYLIGDRAMAKRVVEELKDCYFVNSSYTDFITYLFNETMRKILGIRSEDDINLYRYIDYNIFLTHNNSSNTILIPII